MSYRPSSWLLLIITCAMGISVHGQSIRTEFGKNRIQYHDDFSKWWEYETQNFIVYWYGKGRNIAQSSVQIAEYIHADIQDIVEHRINDKIEIIVYTDVSDLLQSNIGNSETFETRHDETKVIGSRIFVYFDGNHKNLEQKIREGVAHVYLNSMYAPNGLQQVIESNPDLDIPQWYLKGFVSYAASQWDPYIRDELRDLWTVRRGRYQDFDCLASDHPRVAGHALWHYLEQEYGRTSITTLLYLMRLRKDFDDNIEFVFGFKFKNMKKDWTQFYQSAFDEEQSFSELNEDEEIDLGYKKYFPKSLLSLSPDGTQLIYAVNEIGKYQLVLMDLESRKKRTLMRYGSKNAVQQTDYNYPLVAWHPNLPEITIAYEHHDIITLRKVNLNTGEYVNQTIPENLQRIYSIDYVSDEEYVMTGVENGYSDIYTYHARYRRVTAITEDYHDDIDASYVQLGGQWGVLWSSNRPQAQLLPERLDTTLPIGNFDIFFLPLNNSEFALRLTNTPNKDERQPNLVNQQYLTYLDDFSGMKNRWVLDLNSRRSAYMNSNLPRNIILHEAIANDGKYIYEVYNDGAYETYISTPYWTNRQEYQAPTNASTPEQSPTPILIEEEPDTPIAKELTPGQLVQSEFDDPEYIEPLENNVELKKVKHEYHNDPWIADTKREVIEFVPARAVASRRKFKIEEVVTKVDNEVLFEGLESNVVDTEIEAQQPGFLIKAITKDIFEDFEVVVGGRIPTNFKGSEFFAYVDDKRHRIDKRYALYRRQRTQSFGQNDLRQTSLIGLYRMSYPFSTYRSIRGTGYLRLDNSFLLNENPAAVEFGKINEQRVSLKGEYVYDNTLDIDLNLRHGTRYKAYVELINRFDLSLDGGLDFDFSRAITSVIGFDARHYIPFLRNSIIALRAAGASSFGSEKMLYYIGGTDGWITPKYDEQTPVPAGDNFAYKTIAPNLRGFNHNVRNGHNFLLGSAELRLPLFKYFSRRELRSKFLRNFQLTGFVDVGSAWHGLLPSSEKNDIINTATISAPGVVVQVDLDKNTFVYGYGAGARIKLLGYFIRADYAWGVESGLTSDPKLYISLGTEF